MEQRKDNNEEMKQETQEVTYRYTYQAVSLTEKKEVESILKDYLPQEESDLDKLKRLNDRVQTLPRIVALTLGIFGMLIFGGGLSLVLEVGGKFLFGGVFLSAVGALVAVLAYPVYQAVLKKQKRKYGEEIVRLCKTVLHTDEE